MELNRIVIFDLFLFCENFQVQKNNFIGTNKGLGHRFSLPELYACSDSITTRLKHILAPPTELAKVNFQLKEWV